MTGPGVDEPPFVDAGAGRGADESLVLDIGDGVGALMLFTTEEAVGLEIEVGPVTHSDDGGSHGHGRSHDDGHGGSHHDGDRVPRTHTLIRRRRLNGHDVFVGVYPELAAGRWQIFGLHDEIVATVEIESGHVTEFRAVAHDRPGAGITTTGG